MDKKGSCNNFKRNPGEGKVIGKLEVILIFYE